MAITSESRTEIIELVVGMFNAAPGADYLSEFVNAYEAGSTRAQLAEDLAATSVFQSIYPDLQTSEEFATKLVNSLVGDLVDADNKAWAVDWIVSQLNAGSSKAEVIIAAIDALSDAAGDATWGAAATALANKVEVAEWYSVDQLASSTSLSELQNVIADVTEDPATVTAATSGSAQSGQTFTLTTAVDAVSGTSNNDTINGVVSATAGESTMTLADTIDGSGGTDTFNLTVAGAAVSMAASEIKNVEVFNIKNLTGANTAHDFGNVTGETQVWNKGSTVDVAVTGLDAAAIGVANTTTNMTATFKDSTFAADSNLSLALNNAGDKNTDSTITVGQATAAGEATSVSIAASGSNFVTLDAGANAVSAANGIKTLTVTGTGSVDVDNTSDLDNDGANTLGATLTKVDASSNTGGLTIQLANKDVAVTGGTGADKITLANNGAALTEKASVSLGAGDDSLLNNGSAGVGTKAVLDGGAGTDTIASTLLEVGNQANIKNFEIMDLAGENRTIDAALFQSSTFESLALTAALGGATTVQNLAGSELAIDLIGGAVSYGTLTATLKDAATGTADNATITFADKGNSDVASLTSSGLETVAIVSGGDKDTYTNEITNFADKANSLTTITITGANDFTLGDVDVNTAETAGAAKETAAALTTIDGSAATGDLSITAGADDVVGNVTTTYDGLTIKGGSGDDAISNAAVNGVVSGGAGDDTITVSGKGASVDTGAAGTAGDTVNVNAADVSVTVGDAVQTVVVQAGAVAGAAEDMTSVTGAAKSDVIDLSALAAAATTATDANAAIASAASLSEALDLAADAAGAAATADISFFNWVDGNTYLVADVDGTTTAGFGAADAVVQLVGTYDSFSVAAGVVTLG